MAHNIYRLASTILNKPQLITQAAFEPIAGYLTGRLSPNFFIGDNEDNEEDEGHKNKKRYEIMQGKALIKIHGPLTYKPVKMLCAPDTVSYLGLLEDVEEVIELGVDTIVFEHSSGGGQAFGCFSTANEIRRMLDDSGVRSISYIEEGSYSASYALACISDEVIINPDASCGSIGCLIALTNYSKANEKEGIQNIYVSFPTGKVPFAEDGSFTEKFLDSLNEDVTRLGTDFANHVSKYTGISVENVIGLDAQTFYAEKALELGLVNKVMSHSDFVKYLTKQEQ